MIFFRDCPHDIGGRDGKPVDPVEADKKGCRNAKREVEEHVVYGTQVWRVFVRIDARDFEIHLKMGGGRRK